MDRSSNILIIGGSDAGISAGLRARQLDSTSQVTLVLEDRFPNFSICGLPFYVSGETHEWNSLAHRSLEELQNAGLDLLMERRATRIDASSKTVDVEEAGGTHELLRYDRLIVATGARPIRPTISGLELPGVHVLHSMEDSFQVRERAEGSKQAIIVGGGYIGLEMADALTHRGIKCTLVEMAHQVMTNIDSQLAALLSTELANRGVELVTGTTVEAIQSKDERLVVIGSGGFKKAADLVLVVVGVQPNAELAAQAGVRLGIKGAIQVNRRMETNVLDVFAAGDCAETYHRLLDRPTFMPLGTTAHKQGRVAGENSVGGPAEFAGSLGTQVVKIFDLAVARTGLRDAEALEAGYESLTVETEEWDHKIYYPGATRLHIRVTGDRSSGKLLGAQMVGDHRAQVAKRIDIFAAAMYCGLDVADLERMDLSYTPPFSAPWDPVQMAAAVWLARI
jgi:NADPH-dependent 2,4-dienoyl-CoA reductase/sulfur reductase-like enzyme